MSLLNVDDDDDVLFRRLSLHHLRNTQKCGAKKKNISRLKTHGYHIIHHTQIIIKHTNQSI